MINKLKGKDAVQALYERYDKYPDFQEGVEEEYTKLLIGKMIYDARIESGLTQKELADRIGTQQSAIARLEDANYDGHSLPMLQKIATALHKRIEIRFAPLEDDSIRDKQLSLSK